MFCYIKMGFKEVNFAWACYSGGLTFINSLMQHGMLALTLGRMNFAPTLLPFVSAEFCDF